MTDPIANLLTRIRNSSRANLETLSVPHSKIKCEILEVLVKNNYLENFKIERGGKFPEIKITLKKLDHPLNLKRISKPGQRVYVKNKNISKVQSGLGISILSTSKGIMTNRQARKSNLGGELICEVY